MAQPTTTQLNATEQDTLVKQIGLALLRAAPRDWRKVTAEYRAVGRYHEMTGEIITEDGTLHEWVATHDIATLFGRLRAGMYRDGRGTWFNARYQLDHPSSYNLEYNRDEPTWHLAPPPQAYSDELRTFPRSEDNVPEWLIRRMSGLGPEQPGPHFRIARIFDAIGQAGRPVLNRPDLDGDEQDRLLDYLDRAPLVVTDRGYDIDRLAQTPEATVPVAFHSDGQWIWPAAVNYYLRVYAVSPEADLIDHVRANGFTLPEVDEPTRQAAAGYLTRGNPPPQQQRPPAGPPPPAPQGPPPMAPVAQAAPPAPPVPPVPVAVPAALSQPQPVEPEHGHAEEPSYPEDFENQEFTPPAQASEQPEHDEYDDRPEAFAATTPPEAHQEPYQAEYEEQGFTPPVSPAAQGVPEYAEAAEQAPHHEEYAEQPVAQGQHEDYAEPYHEEFDDRFADEEQYAEPEEGSHGALSNGSAPAGHGDLEDTTEYAPGPRIDPGPLTMVNQESVIPGTLPIPPVVEAHPAPPLPERAVHAAAPEPEAPPVASQHRAAPGQPSVPAKQHPAHAEPALTELQSRLDELDVPEDNYRLGARAEHGWSIEQVDEGWRVGWYDRELINPAVFGDAEDAAAFMLGKVLLNPNGAVPPEAPEPEPEPAPEPPVVATLSPSVATGSFPVRPREEVPEQERTAFTTAAELLGDDDMPPPPPPPVRQPVPPAPVVPIASAGSPLVSPAPPPS
ncbi:hypothetical protein QMK34_42055, partial [Amycolatopsis sp. H20-H5]